MDDRSSGLSKSRLANRKARRQQLIDATIRSIAKYGFSGTTLDTVTKGARLSHGVVNFHFESKEDLYDQTLGYLTKEHYELWYEAMLDAGPDPADQLRAMIEVDFDPGICAPEKLAVWFAFWGQAKYRPNYLTIHGSYDEQRFVQIARLCNEIAREGGYQEVEPDSVARGLDALIDGLWLSLLMYPKWTSREKARGDAFTYLASAFPRHFREAKTDRSAEDKAKVET